ncbi:hypothetical protein ACIHCM_37365 [Streptomyces sp. NPDC052023]|uniref:hypothetical protein n=1 Tax=Streptomyces sp. NPDC052023 TaxID=3365681 RepID=UPI0037D7C135
MLVAAHSRTSEEAAKGRRAPFYPQFCLGLTLDTPTVRTGENAVAVLEQLAELRLPTGTCAADRAYTGCSPENFQVPARRLGYRLALDYKAVDRGIQGGRQGAVLIDGSLACPHIPNSLAQATAGMDDKTFRRRLDELKPVVAERLPYFLKLTERRRPRNRTPAVPGGRPIPLGELPSPRTPPRSATELRGPTTDRGPACGSTIPRQPPSCPPHRPTP